MLGAALRRCSRRRQQPQLTSVLIIVAQRRRESGTGRHLHVGTGDEHQRHLGRVYPVPRGRPEPSPARTAYFGRDSKERISQDVTLISPGQEYSTGRRIDRLRHRVLPLLMFTQSCASTCRQPTSTVLLARLSHPARSRHRQDQCRRGHRSNRTHERYPQHPQPVFVNGYMHDDRNHQEPRASLEPRTANAQKYTARSIGWPRSSQREARGQATRADLARRGETICTPRRTDGHELGGRLLWHHRQVKKSASVLTFAPPRRSQGSETAEPLQRARYL